MQMGSHSGARIKIALLGSYGRPNRPIAGMSDIFVYYASLRLSLSKKNSTIHAQYSQLHSPETVQKEGEKCGRKVVPAKTNSGRKPDPVRHWTKVR